MSKVLGIIAEYNPFHNGHLYHLNKSKELLNPDYTVAIISGNFTQRGNTSLINKWVKTEMALSCGVDLVIELPLLYSISSAENFASGAIKILSALNQNTFLSFGSEVGEINILKNISELLVNEPKEYKTILSHELKQGISYPKARENALLMYLNDVKNYAGVLSKPNNILGIEYLKAISTQKNKVTPFTIKRKTVAYSDTTPIGNLASSTAIRELIQKGIDVSYVIPEKSYKYLENEINYDRCIKDISYFEKEIVYTLRTMSIEEIANLPDVNEGLENKIKNAANSCNDVASLIDLIKSKRYTQTRIQRILLYALLDISKSDIELSQKSKTYIRVLGFNSNGKRLISQIAASNPKLPIITSVKKFVETCHDKTLKHILNKDITASNIFTLGYQYNSKANLDYTNKVIIFE